MRRARYEIIADTPELLLIKDVGSGTDLTVTNDAENVVKELAGRLGSRRLEYYDSDNMRDRILVENGQFVGFELIDER